MAAQRKTTVQRVGLIGLGLMGRGIATSLLSHGFQVVAYNRTHNRVHEARAYIAERLAELAQRRVVARGRVEDWRRRFRAVRHIHGLAGCELIIESVKEDLSLKHYLYDQLEHHVTPDTVIASNTSSFPISLLQKGRRHPERFVVMHWAEPAWLTRFMEIVRNERTSAEALRRTEELGRRCDKDPSVLNFDLRGFIANRLMYAFIREACYLADMGVADIATIDKSFRNDTGWWSALAGPFRWMDLTGIHSYGMVMKGLLPELSNTRRLPATMRKVLATGAEGLGTLGGFYQYDAKTARAWEETWVDFTFEMRRLVKRYEARLKKAKAL